jgi:hypothetical protein
VSTVVTWVKRYQEKSSRSKGACYGPPAINQLEATTEGGLKDHQHDQHHKSVRHAR